MKNSNYNKQNSLNSIIDKANQINFVKDLNFSYDEINKNLAIIFKIYNQDIKCESCDSLDCIYDDKFHEVFYRDEFNNLKTHLVICKKHQQILESQKNLRNFFINNISEKNKFLRFNKTNIDINLDLRSRSKLIKVLISQLKNTSFKSLYLYGSYGIGKTYIMNCYCNELAYKDNRVNYLSMTSFNNLIKSNINMNSNEEDCSNNNYIKEQLKKCDFLFLDDLGIEKFNHFFHIDFLLPILMYRYENKKITYFISNFSIDELKNKYINNIINSRDSDKNEVIKFIDAISSLLGSQPYIINLYGKNLRY